MGEGDRRSQTDGTGDHGHPGGEGAGRVDSLVL